MNRLSLEAPEAIYDMPHGEWKGRYQTEASTDQVARFEATKPLLPFPDHGTQV